tara:strand:+ start:53 stop:490 length:438 start_codon:yes stop_codon:yes gene_type:complete
MSIFLGGTGSSNELHDYEEGNWAVTYPGGTEGSAPTQSYAKYVKIGRMVYVSFYVSSVKTPNNNTQFSIGGLPFTVASAGYGFGRIQYCGNQALGGINLSPLASPATTLLYFHRQDSVSAVWYNSDQRSGYNGPLLAGHIYETDS